MPPKDRKKSLSHGEARSKLCIRCLLKKSCVRKITSTVQVLVERDIGMELDHI